MVEKILPEAALRHDLQRLSSWIVELNVTKVRALQRDSGIENFFQHRLEFRGRQQPGAELVQPDHTFRFLGGLAQVALGLESFAIDGREIQPGAGVRDGRGNLARDQFAEVPIMIVELEARTKAEDQKPGELMRDH